jgi:hypothetical protein
MTTIFDKMIHDMMDALLEKAKATRESYQYSGDEKFVQVAVLIKPDLEPVVMPLAFRNEAEKRKNMRALSLTARLVKAPAVLMVSETRWAHSDKLIPLLGLSPITDHASAEKFEDDYVRILREKYNGELKNLPRECWSEAVVVVAKGPELPVVTRFAPYEEGPGDSIRWLPEDVLTDKAEQWPMLPDWWVQ